MGDLKAREATRMSMTEREKQSSLSSLRPLSQKLKTMQQLSLEHELMRQNTGLTGGSHRTSKSWLDRVQIPKRVSLRTPCWSFKVSFFFCTLVVALIDFFILLKYAVQFSEMRMFSEDFPKRVKSLVIRKAVLVTLLVIIEAVLVLRRK